MSKHVCSIRPFLLSEHVCSMRPFVCSIRPFLLSKHICFMKPFLLSKYVCSVRLFLLSKHVCFVKLFSPYLLLGYCLLTHAYVNIITDRVTRHCGHRFYLTVGPPFPCPQVHTHKLLRSSFCKLSSTFYVCVCVCARARARLGLL